MVWFDQMKPTTKVQLKFVVVGAWVVVDDVLLLELLAGPDGAAVVALPPDCGAIVVADEPLFTMVMPVC